MTLLEVVFRDTSSAGLYRAALDGVGDYRAVFLPWSARPDRDTAWHTRTQAEMYAQRGTHDDLLNQPGIYRQIYEVQTRIELELEKEIASV